MPEYVLRACIGGLIVALLLIAPFFAGREAVAEPAPTAGAAPAPPPVRVPGFWDPRRRPEKPDLSRISVIRFLTETDYPPFNYASPDGNPQGFNIDLARMLCEELKLACTIQMRRFETLIPALNGNQGDAAIASITATVDIRTRVDFTDPYYRTPARFVAKRDSAIEDPLPERLEGKKVGVVAGTAHEAFLKGLFTEAEIRAYPTDEAARLGLRGGEVDLLLGCNHARHLAQRRVFRKLLFFSRRTLHRQPLFRRRGRNRRQERQRHHAAGAELGAVPRLGAGPFHRFVAALFPRQPVLIPDHSGGQPDPKIHCRQKLARGLCAPGHGALERKECAQF